MIVPMKRLTLLALKQDKESTLKALQTLGAVEIIPREDAGDVDAAIIHLNAQLARMNDATKLLKKYAEKGPMFAAPAEVELGDLMGEMPGALELMERTEELEREISLCKSERDKRKAQIAQLMPWVELLSPIESIRPTRNTRYITGFLPNNAIEKLNELALAYEMLPGINQCALVIAVHNDEYFEAQRAVKEIDFTEVTLLQFTGTAGENIKRLEAEITAFDKREEDALAALSETAKEREHVLRGCDAGAIELDREENSARLTDTDAVFILEGWMPAKSEDEVRKTLDDTIGVYYLETRDSLEDETPPSALENPAVARPYESIVEMFSLPSYNGIDASKAVMPFYFLFFGMMLGDTGFGLLLFFGGMLLTKLTKPRGGGAKLVKVITYGGLSSMICGPLFGSFFGMDWNNIFGTVGVFPLIFDPMSDVIEMMVLCCGLGLIHMFVGIGIKMYMCIRDGDVAEAIFNHLSWILLISGILIFALTSGVFSTIGLVMTIIGVVFLLFFSNRKTKNPIKRMGSGLGALYNITGYLSDILSYVRVFALGLVSGAMGLSFNMIGSLVYDGLSNIPVVGSVLGVIVAGAILIVLHLFSLFINVLGAYAHTARLQFIEFFGKFYEAGGVPFKPLSLKTKHVTVKNDSMDAPAAKSEVTGVAG